LGKIVNFIGQLASRLPAARKQQLVDLAAGQMAEVAYHRLSKLGFRPGGIVDIGAYHGDWTRLAAKVYPATPILMVEAQAEKADHLETVARDISQARYELCLLGSRAGAETPFNVMETGSSVYGERSNVPRVQRMMTTRTLDDVLADHPSLQAPLFIKLDVQGAELDVLRGGSRALSQAEIVQLEVALMQYNEGAPDALGVLRFMVDQGFVMYDICGFVRPNPKYLSQIDLLFARRSSSLRPDYFAF